MPTPACERQPKTNLVREIVVVGLANGLRGNIWMQIDRHIELLSPCQDRMEAAIVKEEIFGHTIDEGATEAKVAYRTLKFIGRRLWSAHRQMSKTRETIRMLGYGFRERVVDLACERDALRAIDEVGAGT